MKINIPENVNKIIHKLQDNGFKAYVVGGCCRDSILNIEPHDWDICTSATPTEMLNVFSNEKIVETGLKHGTITIMLDGEGYEATSFRIDGEYSDHRRPDTVEFTSDLYEDLKRRDFTINAMAYNDEEGLIDPYNGLIDLKNKILRCVGNPAERFNEDALRILRAMRFALKYDLDISVSTSVEMIRKSNLLVNVSKERITSELEKMFTLNKSVRELFTTYRFIIGTIIPELIPTFDFDQNNKYHMHNVYEHILYVVDYCDTTDFEIKMAALLHDIGKPQCYVEDKEGHGHFYGHPDVSYDIAQKVLENDLKLSRKSSDMILELVKYHDITIASTEKSVKKALNKHGIDFMYKWFVLKEADKIDHIYFGEWEHDTKIPEVKEILQDILDRGECFTLKDLDLKGQDLIDLGFKPSKELGRTLNWILNEVISGNLVNKKEQLIRPASMYLADQFLNERR